MPSPISQFHLPMSDSARLETKMPKMSEYELVQRARLGLID